MVDRYAKYGTEHLAQAAMRIESARAENVLESVTFLSRHKEKRSQPFG